MNNELFADYLDICIEQDRKALALVDGLIRVLTLLEEHE